MLIVGEQKQAQTKYPENGSMFQTTRTQSNTVIENSFRSVFQLRILMRRLETELGLTKLTHTELDALASVFDLTSTQKYFRAKDVVKHSLLSNASRPTRYRAFKELEEKGWIVRNAGSERTFTLAEYHASDCINKSKAQMTRIQRQF